MGIEIKQVIAVNICAACNDYIWQDGHDLNDPMRDGFQDVADVLWSEVDLEMTRCNVRCGICDIMIPKGWVKSVAGVAFH